jgi:hypothetical protein
VGVRVGDSACEASTWSSTTSIPGVIAQSLVQFSYRC